ncbi:hypothetical protein MBLNU457_4701t2 [Dothideomycetes sp. NU457]
MNLQNKTALVTGGCGGLGATISHALLEGGANVIAIDINKDMLSAFEIQTEGAYSGRVLVLDCDITNETALQALFKVVADKFNQVDIVVNNAGIMDRFEPVGELSMELWNKIIAVNLTAPFAVSKLAVNHFLEQGVQGCIVNVGSASSEVGFAAGAAYTASKHGLIGLTKNTAAFYASKGIRCNAIMPGAMETNISVALHQGYSQEGMKMMQTKMATSKGMTKLQDAASVVAFLCSDAAAALSGACLPVDKGWTAH